MVDARLSADWLGSIRFDDLSDRAFRIFAGALMWSNKHGTDGHVPTRYTRYLHPDGTDLDAFTELEDAGLWAAVDDGFQLVGWSSELHQSTAAEVEKYRESARQRQRAYRERQKDSVHGALGQTSERSGPLRDVTRDGNGRLREHVGKGSRIIRAHELESAEAYATGNTERDVTRHAPNPGFPPSPFCAEHPHGTLEPCGACARARVMFSSQVRPAGATDASRAWDCATDGHKYVVDGSCAVCEIAPERRAS